MGPGIPKMIPFRSQELRDFAQDCPHCMNPACQAKNDTIVLAHSNHLHDGKGMGTKAHDIPCYLCFVCHNIVDGKFFTGDNSEKIRLEAGYYSLLWLLQTKRLVIGEELYED
jgi:hypothetical protein